MTDKKTIILAKRIDPKIRVGEKLFDTEKEMFDYFIKLEKENEQLKLGNSSLEYQLNLMKDQIEKLKTCRSCNKEFTESCETCKRGFYDGEVDNWELAE